MRKLWERLKNAVAALAGRTSAPAPAGGGKKPRLRATKKETSNGGFSASGATTPQKSGRLKAAALAGISRFTTAQGKASKKSTGAAPAIQKAEQAASPAKFTAKHQKSALHRTQKISRQKNEASPKVKTHSQANVEAPQLKTYAQANGAAPQLKTYSQADEEAPQLELTAYPSTALESAVKTVAPNSAVLDAALVNEVLALQYRRYASSIDEQEVL